MIVSGRNRHIAHIGILQQLCRVDDLPLLHLQQCFEFYVKVGSENYNLHRICTEAVFYLRTSILVCGAKAPDMHERVTSCNR